MDKMGTKHELEFLIASCCIQKLTTNESIEFLEIRGFKISQRTFYKYKKELKESVEERTTFILKNIMFQHLRMLDAFERIDKELWDIYEKTDDEKLKLKILKAIKDNQIDMTKYYDETAGALHRQKHALSQLPIGKSLEYKGNLENEIKVIEEQLTEPYLYDLKRNSLRKELEKKKLQLKEKTD